ncbi:aspartate/glutamate racemase family protein [Halalkalibacter kiskunsagensis]|uniref:Aspartate/glutamate racemase family protein n=1 Tax=Halalkalibacter kiskunsagensis TaxID=1548599 RepID=A0ABV6KFP1_9BACI
MVSKKVAVLHTTPVTVEPLKKLAEEKIPGCKVVNFVDDSILPQLIETDGNISLVQDRLVQYAKYAEQIGADVILNACSSVGEVVAKARQNITIPIIRIDEAMAEEAIKRGKKIGVVATLATTLNPTMRLLQEKATEFNKKVEFESELAEEAYQCLITGDQNSHDAALSVVLSNIAKKVDVVVLAQASMARVVSTLPIEQQEMFLASPQLGMERVQQTLEGIAE